MPEEIESAIARDEGQTMAEYALVLSVIVVAVVATVGTFAGGVSDLIQAVADLFS